MMREWATVIAWHDGIATLRCNRRSSCNACRAKATCGVAIMDKVNSNSILEFKLPSARHLSVGQQVELGISEVNLLYSALLVYLVPLLGLFSGAGLSQWLLAGNLSAIIGAAIGGIMGFLAARFGALKLEQRRFYQPVILQVSLAVKTE